MTNLAMLLFRGLGAKPPIKNGCAVGTPFASFSQFSTYPQVGTCGTKVIERLKKVIDRCFVG